MSVTILGDNHDVPGRLLPGAPRTQAWRITRPHLLERLDAGDASRLIVVRASGGSGKSDLLSDWLYRHADQGQLIIWVALDESARSRAAFWHRVIQAFLASNLAFADSPLGDFISGYVELDTVPSLVLAELSRAPQRVRLVLDDLHLVDDTAIDEIIWLLERSNHLQVLATTHHRGRLESPAITVRLDPTVITGSDLAFTLDETVQLFEKSGTVFAHDKALIIREATGGHPLATRIAITTLASTVQGASLDREAVIHRIATDTDQELLPAFSTLENKVVALRLALAPSVDIRLAAELTGKQHVEPILRHFEQEGFGEFRGVGDDAVFAFHLLVGRALEREAERILDEGEVVTLRRIAARGLSARRDALGALRLYARLSEFRAMWPVIAQNFSELIIHHQGELEDVIRGVPQAQLHECGTLAIALAVVRSEQQGLPSTEVLQLVDTGIALLGCETPTANLLERFWILLSTFAGLRAARRYRHAAIAGDAVVSHVDQMPPESRSAVEGAIGAGSIQIVITYILVGRLDDALTLARRLADDPHAGRQQHRRSLLAYIHSFRGDMLEAESLTQTITHARSDTWRATIPATGWHAAEALIRLERNETDSGFQMISELDPRLAVLEHWPYLLWVKGLARLASAHPELGADELTIALAANSSRPASVFALDMLAALRSDLYLAVGQIGRAHLVLAARGNESLALRLSLSRLLLAEGRLDEAKVALAPLQWNEESPPRQQAESLLLHAVVELRLRLRVEALHSTRRAFSLLDRHGLRLPLIMVPQSELRELVSDELPEHLPLFEGLSDPFGEISTPNRLSRREQEVLVALASGGGLDLVASKLFVSVNTIKTQLRSIYRKLGVSSRDEAVSTARRRGLLSE